MKLVWFTFLGALLALVSGCGGADMAMSPPGAKAAPSYYGGVEAEEQDVSDADAGGAEMDGPMLAEPAPMMDNRVARAEPPPGQGAPPPPPPPPATSKPDATGPVTPKASKTVAPLLIYRGTFHMAVFETGKSVDAVQKLAKDLGGYLVRRDQRSIVVRIPTAKYPGALDAIAKLGDVLHREETVEDVTEKFYDLQTRLRNARAMRARFEQLLQKAKDVKEALAVERELGRVTAQIEQMEGKLKLLRELINYSTITVQFKPRDSENVNSNVRLPFQWLDQMGLSNLLNL